EGLDPHDAAGEADQDRGQGGPAFEVRGLSVGGGRGTTEVVRGDPGPDRPVAAGVRVGLSYAALAKPVRTSSPCVRGAPLGRLPGDERRRSVGCAGLRLRGGGYRRRGGLWGWRGPRVSPA